MESLHSFHLSFLRRPYRISLCGTRGDPADKEPTPLYRNRNKDANLFARMLSTDCLVLVPNVYIHVADASTSVQQEVSTSIAYIQGTTFKCQTFLVNPL